MHWKALLLGPSLAGGILIASCGARTGLTLRGHHDASISQMRETGVDSPFDAPIDVPEFHEGHILDVNPDCNAPTYCVDGDPNYVYKCGERVRQCSSLEQCEVRCTDGGTTGDASPVDGGNCSATCVNPCKDSLGSDTSNGCEFYAAEMDTTHEAQGVCYAVFVVNQWSTGVPAKLLVDLAGQTLPLEQFARIPVGTGTDITYAPFDPAVGLPQNQVAVLFLSRDPEGLSDPNPTDPRFLANCPPGIQPAVLGDAAIHGTGFGQAFHITSNVPIVAYQMLPYGGGSARVTGATLLLPTNVWGDNYIAANAYHYPTMLINEGGTIDPGAGPTMLIMAKDDNTHVTISPVTNIVAGPGVPGVQAGVPMTYTIDQGQYIQFTQQFELSGSPIQSDKPVALIGGATLMDVPTSSVRGDHGEQMIPPVKALASSYVGVRYKTRSPGVEESVPWRVFGAVDGTLLTYDPPIPPPGAPLLINSKQVIEFNAPGPFVISSQDAAHPFYFAQYMSGGQLFQGIGDPEFVNVISPKQYLSRYTFFTDPTYPETNLVVIREIDAASGEFPDVNLDCAGTLTGWRAVGTSGTYQFTRIDLSADDFQGQNGCNNGVHTMTASFPAEAGLDAAPSTPRMGVTIWGWGSPTTDPGVDDGGDETQPNFTLWVSYAYPAGANITKLNSVVVPAQ